MKTKPAIVANRSKIKAAVEKKISEARLLQSIRPHISVSIWTAPNEGGEWVANIQITDTSDGRHLGIGSASATATENPWAGIVEWKISRIGWSA